ncbi:mucin-2-like [Camelus dromedarius]|uniref:mucin-2-like n=1 Tax=Camelus dromedarius TaxID=9838 RepID=UPI00311A737E
MFPGVPLQQLGQTVVCDTSVGLVCKNQDQKPGGATPMPYCLNYEINVYCCVPRPGCTTTHPSTTSGTRTPTPTATSTEPPTSTSTTTETTTPSTTTTSETITPSTTTTTGTTTPSTTTTTETTTPSTTTTSETTTPSTITTTETITPPCVPVCNWTGWLDSAKPNFTKEGGDVESVENVCKMGSVASISCRAAMFPGVPLQQLGQTVVCDTSVGLVCKNQDQKPGGATPMPYCLNYEINVYCCVPRPGCTTTHPSTTSGTGSPTPTTTSTEPPTSTSTTTETSTPSTTTTTETTTPSTTTTSETTTPSTITTTETTTPSTTTTTGTTTPSTTTTTETTTPSTTTTSETTTPSTTTSTETTTPPCVPVCNWTGWLDSAKPNFTKEGGDVESVENVCKMGSVASISCRAAMFPGVPLQQLGQTVVCDTSVGLVCKNQDQKTVGATPMPYCLNYEINVYCCVPRPGCTTTHPSTTSGTGSPTPTATSTEPPTSTSTTTETSTPSTTTTTETTTPSTTTTSETTTPSTITTTETTTPSTTSTTGTTTPSTTTTTETTTPSTTTTSETTTPSTITTTETITPPCVPVCNWTGWLDSAKPNFTKEAWTNCGVRHFCWACVQKPRPEDSGSHPHALLPQL